MRDCGTKVTDVTKGTNVKHVRCFVFGNLYCKLGSRFDAVKVSSIGIYKNLNIRERPTTDPALGRLVRSATLFGVIAVSLSAYGLITRVD